MVSSEMKASTVIAGRGARACDMCGKERAKWYCAADEAYLCERCDGSVHFANAVAKRHERVRIGHHGAPAKLKPLHHTKQHHHHHDDMKTKSNKSTLELEDSGLSLDSLKRDDDQVWCTTSRKRKRTPRRGFKLSAHLNSNRTLTANLKSCSFATIKEEKDDASDLLLYDLLTEDDQLCGDLSGRARFKIKTEQFSPSSTLTSGDFLEVKAEESDFAHEVPTYEPLLQDLIACGDEAFMEKLMPSSPSLCNVSCSSRTSTSIKIEVNSAEPQCKEVQLEAIPFNHETEPLHMYDLVDSSGGDINEGVSISEDSDIDTFDVMDLCSNATFDDSNKADEMKDGLPDMEIWKCAYRLDQAACTSIFEGNPFKGKGEKDLDFGCMQDTDCLQGEDLKPQQCAQQPRPLSLHLDYEDVINTWSDRGSFWMDGQRPQLVPDINFLYNGGVESGMVMMVNSNCNTILSGQAGQVPSLVVVDKAREARVLRYKEKRRNRLFSKKIRYEVRKLNAERRPRMKGRFVKRAAIAAIAAM